MRQKLLSSFRLRVVMLVAILCSMFSKSSWGQVASATPANGKSYVVAAYVNNKYYALPNKTTNGGTLAGKEITLNAINKVNIADASENTWILEEGSTLGQFYLKYTSGGNTYYLYKNGTSTSNNNFKVSTTDKNYWSFTTNGTGYTVTAISRGSNHLNIQCNNGTFRCYSSATPIILLEIGDETSDPIISATNTEIASYATSGEFNYTITNPVENTALTASITAGGTWLSNAVVDATNGKVTFTTTVNTDEDNAREGTIRLVYGDNLATMDVTITQAAAPKKYTVTIETPTGGTLVVKNGENTINSGDKLAIGTVLTIEATADATHKYKNWQYKKGTGSWETNTTDFDYTIDANDVSFKATFDATYPVNWSVNGTVTATTRFAEGETITLADAPADIDGRTFVGWVAETITGTTDEAPTFLTAPVMGTSEVTYYAVFAEAEGTGELVETKSQTLQYDTWSYSGTTKDMNTYRLFGNDSYVESSAFDLSTLSKVIVYAGTYGNLSNSNKKVTVKAGSTTWGTKTLSTNSATTENEITSSLSLSGTGTINIVSNGGDANNNGIRISKIEIFVKTLDLIYSNYCTTVAPDTRALVNMIAFSATATRVVKGNTTTTAVTNDQADWTAAYTYESDNTDVATVDANGVITAVAKGTANITATLNVDKNDTNYKAGDTKSMSVEITVKNPSHTVAFYNNGIKLSEAEVEEEDNITFPSNPTFGTFEFVGWASAEIEGSAATAPATVTSASMGTEDINYYAVYGDVQKKNVTATFDAAETSNLTRGSGLTWTDNETGIILSISSGQLYAGDDTHPAAWNITKSTSTSDYCMTLGRENCQIKKVSATTTAADYAVGDYYAYSKYDDENGTDLTNNVITNGLISTLTLENNYELVALWSTTNYQTRLTVVEVEAIVSTPVAYYTTLAETANVTAAGWGTYVTKHDVEFEAGNAYVVTEADEKTTLVEVTEVPAGTPVLLKGEGIKTATFVASTPSAPATNLLHVSDGTIDADAGAYVLGNKNGQVGFYKWTGTALAAGKVYLLPTTNAREFIGFDDDSTTTGINSIDNGQQTYDNVYDLQGRRVAQPAKGMYIVNGKKVIM